MQKFRHPIKSSVLYQAKSLSLFCLQCPADNYNSWNSFRWSCICLKFPCRFSIMLKSENSGSHSKSLSSHSFEICKVLFLSNSYGFFGQMAQFSIYLSLKEVFYIQTLLYVVHTRTFMMRLHVEAVSAADKRSSFKRGHTSHRLCLFLFSHWFEKTQ